MRHMAHSYKQSKDISNATEDHISHPYSWSTLLCINIFLGSLSMSIISLREMELNFILCAPPVS